MDAEQCNDRAAECAANARIAADEATAGEFMKLAAQWRAMAVRDIFLGAIDDIAGAAAPGLAIAPRSPISVSDPKWAPAPLLSC